MRLQAETDGEHAGLLARHSGMYLGAQSTPSLRKRTTFRREGVKSVGKIRGGETSFHRVASGRRRLHKRHDYRQ